MDVGVNYQDKSCEFVVWAPNCSKVFLLLTSTQELYAMAKARKGYWTLAIDGLKEESEYLYKLDDQILRSDPASNFQPQGVFGSSQIINHESFNWSDTDWQGLTLDELVFYELHVGTFTREGTFKAVSSKVKELAEIGVNAIELMPVAQFPGKYNWGYDVSFPFAVHNTYGHPEDLKKLANECHRQGIALFADVVYNHAGPEGNFLNDYGPYFLKNRKTQWGPPINLDGPLCGPVRDYFMQNTLHWLKNYHLDGLRLDAILFMLDNSPEHFLGQLTSSVHRFSRKLKRKVWLVAETSFNQPVVLKPSSQGGYGFDAQWLDDYQHALHAVLTGERDGYYRNYGKMSHLKEALTEAYVHVGGGFPNSRLRLRKPTESFSWINSNRLVVFSQNHDQIGNRLLSERLTVLAGYEAAKTAAGLVLLSPYVPLLFMGEEYGETRPFNFFVNYNDKELLAATREGRKREFSRFHWKGESPDPSSEQTFEQSKLNWAMRSQEQGKKMLAYYQALIQLRHSIRTGKCYSDRTQMQVQCSEKNKILFIKRCMGDKENVVVANLSSNEKSYRFPFEGGDYRKVLDSADVAWNGPGVLLSQSTKKGDNNFIRGFNFAFFEKN